MKYVLLIGDGMADYPIPELNNYTPLQAAHKPAMDCLARQGVVGLVQTIPPGMPAGSDIATMSIFGYDPVVHYTGRGPLEAVGMGIPIDDNAVAFRCNLVTVQGDLLADYSAGAISSEEGRELVTLLNEQLVSLALGCVAFYPGVSYRHLLVASNGFGDDLQCWPPHDVIGQSFGPYLPKGQGAELLCQLMEASRSLLADHPVNRRRVEQGRNPANMIWLWGQGRLPRLVSFPQRRGVGGAVITAVDVIRGLGRLAGLGVMRVPGVTGELNTNYEGKVAAALGVLEEHDFVCVHVEAPDEAAHHGSLEDKIAAVESFDRRVVKPMLEGLQARYTAFKVLMLTDHYTPLSLRTHSPEPVPFAIYTAGGKGGLADSFDEASAQEDSLVFTKGYRLMDFFISD